MQLVLVSRGTADSKMNLVCLLSLGIGRELSPLDNKNFNPFVLL